MPEQIRVLLVDDDPMVCTGIDLILSSAADISVVGTANDGGAAIAAAQQHRPDVVLMDVRMPVMDGIAATEQVRKLPTPPEVIVLTTFEEDEYVVRSVRAGAAGFLLKTSNPEQIIGAIRAVSAGESAISAASARSLFSYVAARPDRPQTTAHDLISRLSRRELEVARGVRDGHSNAAIAQRLYLSETTVKTHLATVQDKLGVRNRVGIAVIVERASSNPGTEHDK